MEVERLGVVVSADDEVANVDQDVVIVRAAVEVIVVSVDGPDEEGSLVTRTFVFGEIDRKCVDQKLWFVVVHVLDVDCQVEVRLEFNILINVVANAHRNFIPFIMIYN